MQCTSDSESVGKACTAVAMERHYVSSVTISLKSCNSFFPSHNGYALHSPVRIVIVDSLKSLADSDTQIPEIYGNSNRAKQLYVVFIGRKAHLWPLSLR